MHFSNTQEHLYAILKFVVNFFGRSLEDSGNPVPPVKILKKSKTIRGRYDIYFDCLFTTNSL